MRPVVLQRTKGIHGSELQILRQRRDIRAHVERSTVLDQHVDIVIG